MPLDPSIISNSFANISTPDVNALMQQRVQGAENVYQIETARQAQAAEAEKEAAKQAAEAMLPAVASAFSDPSDAGLDAATSMLPPEVAEAFTPFMQRLKGIADPKMRMTILRAELAKDEEGKFILSQLEPSANMRLQEATAGRRAALDERRLALEEAKLAAEAEGGGVSPDVAARLEFDREKFAAEQAEKAKVASGEAPPTELKKGERWNAETGRVEAVPGSETYNKQKSTHAKDLQGAANVDRQLQDVEDAVSDLMKTSDWQKMTNTGAVMARLPNVAGLSSLTGGYDFQTKLKNLEGVLKTLGRADATTSGKLGNMAIQEWRYVADAIANLDLTNMDTNDLNEQLDIIMSKAREIRANIEGGYEQEWGGSQFYSKFPKSEKRKQAKSGRPGGVGPDWTLETDAQGNKAWVSPDRQDFIEVE